MSMAQTYAIARGTLSGGYAHAGSGRGLRRAGKHALTWALSASPLLTKLFVAPGNPGTGMIAENVPIGEMHIDRLVQFAQEQAIGPRRPRAPKRPWSPGPGQRARPPPACAAAAPAGRPAQLEGSKAFTKALCDAASIPTARWEHFDDPAAAPSISSNAAAPPSWSRPTASPPARASSSPPPSRRPPPPSPALTAGGGTVSHRGVPYRPGSQPVRPLRRHGRPVPRHRPRPQARRRRRRRSQHPAAWAPTPPSPASTPPPPWTASSAPPSPRWPAAAPLSAASCSPA